MKLLAVLIGIALIIISPSISIATDVTQNIVQDTTWVPAGNPYTIQSDIRVYPGITLTIEPGVEVIIHVESSLIIGGKLVAVGQQANLIIFRSELTVPAYNQPAGLIFESTAESASFLGAEQPDFSYDHVNREVTLTYVSGSILEYCHFSALPTAIELNSCFPYISRNHITDCPQGILINQAGGTIPYPQWFFLYRNTIQNCSRNAIFVDLSSGHYFPFTLFSGNIFQNNEENDQGWAVYVSHLSGDTVLFLFNNQVINNKGTGVIHHGPYTLLYADNNQMSGNNQGMTANCGVFLNNTITNNICPKNRVNPNGAGIYLNGPKAVLFNNTIQGNEVCPGDRGDNIMLKSQQGSQYTTRYNNIGNSSGDQIDLYLDADYQGVDCNTSSNINVNATNNFWTNRAINNLSNNIFDHNDDFCAGTVDFQPILQAQLTTNHAGLLRMFHCFQRKHQHQYRGPHLQRKPAELDYRFHLKLFRLRGRDPLKSIIF